MRTICERTPEICEEFRNIQIAWAVEMHAYVFAAAELNTDHKIEFDLQIRDIDSDKMNLAKKPILHIGRAWFPESYVEGKSWWHSEGKDLCPRGFVQVYIFLSLSVSIHHRQTHIFMPMCMPCHAFHASISLVSKPASASGSNGSLSRTKRCVFVPFTHCALRSNSSFPQIFFPIRQSRVQPETRRFFCPLPSFRL